MNKDFQPWLRRKSELHQQAERPLGIKEREVWWCAIGVNVGFEEDGKNVKCNRPVLILKVFNRALFVGIPLSTTEKRGKFYFAFELNGKTSVALLSQIRVLDSARIKNDFAARIGRMEQTDFEKLKDAMKAILFS